MPSQYDPDPGPKLSVWSSTTAATTRPSGRRSRPSRCGLGMNGETLRNWIHQQQIDGGQGDEVSIESAREIRELKRKNAELEQTVAVLKAATTFFVRESDPRSRR